MVVRDLLGTNLSIESAVGKAFNLDTIVLSDFVRIPKGTRLVGDFGCGNASIMLYLSQKFEGNILGIEIQEDRYRQALLNIKNNQLDQRLKVINQDLKTFKSEKSFDVIVSNPPFFKLNDDTKRSSDLDMMIAKHEIHLNLAELVSTARKNIKHHGLFFLIHKADRLEELILALNENDFRLKRMRFVHPNISSEPNQVLIEARYKGKEHLTVMPPLIQYKDKDIYSDEMHAIYQGRSYKK